MKIIKFIGILSLCVFVAACTKDEKTIGGSGISEETWSAENILSADGKMHEYTFVSGGAWYATSNNKWCRIVTESGVTGKSSLRFKTFANTDSNVRNGAITITVSGFSDATIINLVQKGGVNEQGEGKYRAINEWIADSMKETYLWNEPIDGLMLDYSLDYQKFLTSILEGVAADNDVNHDDGIWKGEKREAWYTQIQSKAPISKSVGAEYTDAGFLLLQPTTVGSGAEVPVGAAVMVVTPGTPADNAGIKRGDFITEVDDVKMTEGNYKELVNKLYQGNVKAKVNTVSWKEKEAIVTFKADVEIGSATYTDPAIYAAKIIPAENGKKIGYILYMGFATAYDEQLIEIFANFKKENVTDLIVDLRYNPGGEVLSSTVLNTLIAGEAHKGKISTKLVYNKARTEAGESGEYKIGVAQNVEYPEGEGYTPIVSALGSSLGLNTVYIITGENTASASEIIINGLQGLDLDVRLIGQKTHGKNVGMEGFQTNMYGYNFYLYPVSFYPDNAKGFHDYPEGFTPDIVVNDANIYPGDFGTKVDLCSLQAITWIETGSMPNLSVSKREICRTWDTEYERLCRRQGGAVIYPGRNALE